MRVVDTSAWIEWVIGSTVGLRIIPLLPELEDWVVPTIVQYELAKWEMRMSVEPQQGLEVVAFSRKCRVIPLSTGLAVEASSVAAEHKLATADAIVYATARQFDAELLTCDAHFRDLPGVIYLKKSLQ